MLWLSYLGPEAVSQLLSSQKLPAKVQPPLPSASKYATLARNLLKHGLFDPVTESLCPGLCPSGTWANPEHDDAYSIDAESFKIVLPLPHRACAFIISCS